MHVLRFEQELIEPAKLAREHVSSAYQMAKFKHGGRMLKVVLPVYGVLGMKCQNAVTDTIEVVSPPTSMLMHALAM